MAYKQFTDMELWQCCQNDDINAYNELFRRYSKKVFATCQYYLHDPIASEEIALDIMFWLWNKRHSTSIHKDLSAYLHRASRNAIISYRRKQHSEVILVHQEELESGQIGSRSADYNLRCMEGKQHYENLLAGLSPKRKAVFLLSREEGLSYQQIAAKTKLSVNTIENYMVAVLKYFRQEIGTIILITFLFL